MRRLMRNRHSAQVSRDRRRRALEDQRRLKEAKEEEIRALERIVSEEIQCLMRLEQVVDFARDYLGADMYSKVAAPFHVGGDKKIVAAAL